MNRRNQSIQLLFLIMVMVLAGCEKEQSSSPTPLLSLQLATETHPVTLATDTPIPPTSTPIPLAATVNGEPLTLAEYEAELARFQAAQASSGTLLATEEAAAWVLDNLIDTLLLAQAAGEAGFLVDEADIQNRMDDLVDQLGDPQALVDWIADHNYSEAEFRQALGREMAAAWMRDQIAAGVAETAEQVHARQILLYNSVDAEQVLAQLQNGQDFAVLAATYDPITGGDLGWFPRGILVNSIVEEVAFSLEPGQFSEVIETPLGYHIIQLVERDPQHPLSPDARQALQLLVLKAWLSERRSQSIIQVLVP